MANQDSDENLFNNNISGADLSLIANNSEQNYILLDPDYRIIAFNNKAKNQYLKYLGKTLKVGISIIEFSHDSEKEVFTNTLKRVSEGSEEEHISNFEIEGSPTKFVLSRLKQAFDNDGQYKGILISSTDVTNVKHTEAEKNTLEENSDFEKENLKALINNSKSHIWSFDREFKLITFNQTFEDKVKSQSNIQPKIGDNFTLYDK